MISLSVVEHELQKIINEEDNDVMAVVVPDDKKGERIALLYIGAIPEDELRARVLGSDIEKMMVPFFYLKMEELPKLGSGKKDYVTAKKIAIDHFLA